MKIMPKRPRFSAGLGSGWLPGFLLALFWGLFPVAAAELPVVRLEVKEEILKEPTGATDEGHRGRVRLVRAGDNTAPLTVVFTVAGSAEYEADYTWAEPVQVEPRSRMMAIIPAGASSLTLHAVPVPDSEPEEEESIVVQLQPSADYHLGEPREDRLTLRDAGAPNLPPVVEIIRETYAEYWRGTAPLPPWEVLIRASDPDGRVTQVALGDGGVVVESREAVPGSEGTLWILRWPKPKSGSRVFIARAEDNAGGVSHSPEMEVVFPDVSTVGMRNTASVGTDEPLAVRKDLPSPRIISPADGAVFTAASWTNSQAFIPLVAEVHPKVRRPEVKVLFLLGKFVVAKASYPDYQAHFSSLRQWGKYPLTAVLEDPSGRGPESEPVTFTVLPPPSTVQVQLLWPPPGTVLPVDSADPPAAAVDLMIRLTGPRADPGRLQLWEQDELLPLELIQTVDSEFWVLRTSLEGTGQHVVEIWSGKLLRTVELFVGEKTPPVEGPRLGSRWALTADETFWSFQFDPSAWPLSHPVSLVAPPPGVTGWRYFDDRTNIVAIDLRGNLWETDMLDRWNPVPRPPAVAGWRTVAGWWGQWVALGTAGEAYSWSPIGSAEKEPVLQEGRRRMYHLWRPPGVSGWQAVSSASQHVLLLSEDGRVFTWNWRGTRDLSILPSAVWPDDTPAHWLPMEVPRPPGVGRWLKIVATRQGSYALADDGNVYGWGVRKSPNYDLLLTGDRSSAVTAPSPVPRPPDGAGWTDFVAQDGALLLRTADGRVFLLSDPHRGNRFSLFPLHEILPSGTAGRWLAMSAGGMGRWIPVLHLLGNDGRVYEINVERVYTDYPHVPPPLSVTIAPREQLPLQIEWLSPADGLKVLADTPITLTVRVTGGLMNRPVVRLSGGFVDAVRVQAPDRLEVDCPAYSIRPGLNQLLLYVQQADGTSGLSKPLRLVGRPRLELRWVTEGSPVAESPALLLSIDGMRSSKGTLYRYEIESSADLRQWEYFGELLWQKPWQKSGLIIPMDPNSGQSPRQFYRVRMRPEIP